MEGFQDKVSDVDRPDILLGTSFYVEGVQFPVLAQTARFYKEMGSVRLNFQVSCSLID